MVLYLLWYFTWLWEKENVLFNDAFDTFYLWLCGVRHMVKDHSDLVREKTCSRHMSYSFRSAARVLLYELSHRQDNTCHGLYYTSGGALAETRNRSIHPTTHCTMSERSYHGATSRSFITWVWEINTCKYHIRLSNFITFQIWQSPNIIRKQDVASWKSFHSWCSGSLSYFSFQAVLHDWCNKGCGMCYPICGMVHIKYPILLFRNSSSWSSSSRFLHKLILCHMSRVV